MTQTYRCGGKLFDCRGEKRRDILNAAIQHFESQPGYKPVPAKTTGKVHKIC
jgi:hypothetical protein